LHKLQYTSGIRSNKAVYVWNSLPTSANFANFVSFNRSLKHADLSDYMICEWHSCVHRIIKGQLSVVF